MSRSRNIKPGFFKNEDLVEQPFEYRLLFAGLWTESDREGRCEDRPTKLKMAIFPGDSVDVEAGLVALESAGFILRYQVDGKRFIQVLTWKKHQNPHFKEAKSTIPAPDPPALEDAEAPGSPAMDDTPAPGSAAMDGHQTRGKPEASPRLDPEKTQFHEGQTGLIPDSLLLIPDSKEEAKAKAGRGSRLSPDWKPDEVLLAWAKSERPGVDLKTQIENFRDYWTAKSGKDATKLDWTATFRMWIRNSNRGSGNGSAPRPSAESAVERVKRANREAGYAD